MAAMSRPQRMALGGYVYHVLNRANGRLRIFRKDSDFLAFERILAEGTALFSMRLCGYCIMGNHWHLLLWPQGDGELSHLMRSVTLTHTRRYHASHGTTGIGHSYQGRYESFPVQSDPCYLRVLRYIETNPVRAGIVREAAQGGTVVVPSAGEGAASRDPVGPCASRIIRARKDKRPGTRGRSRNLGSEACRKVLPKKSPCGPEREDCDSGMVE